MATDLLSNPRYGANAPPKLLAGGTNWVSYKDRMEQYLLAQPGARKHLTGRAKQPVEPTAPSVKNPKAPTDAEAKLLDAYDEALDAYETEMDDFLRIQAQLISIINQSIPADLHQQLIGVRPVSELWRQLTAKFANQSILVLADLLIQLMEIRCTGDDDEDPLSVIQALIEKRNEYIEAGGELQDAIYAALLIKAMPKQYRPVIHAAITTTGGKLDFETVHTALREAIRLDQSQTRREREEARAMAARFRKLQPQQNPTKNAAGGSGNTGRKCTVCGSTRHLAKDCWAPGGGAEGQGPAGYEYGFRTKRDEGADGKSAKPGAGADKGSARVAEGTAQAENSQGDREGFSFSAHGRASYALASVGTALRATTRQLEVRLLDTGASRHYDGNRDNFTHISPCEPYEVTTASGIEIATEKGTVEFECHQGDDVRCFTLHNVYYLPNCTTPLISIGRLRRKGLVFTNQEDGYGVLYKDRDPQQCPILRVKQDQDVYPLLTWRPGHSAGVSAAASAHRPLTLTEAHLRLGHLAHSTIETMVKSGTALNFDVDLTTPITECAPCIRAKMRNAPIAKQRTDPHGNALGDRISADTWGPAPTEARGGFKYYCSLAMSGSPSISLASEGPKGGGKENERG